jgi:hypothetical protein
MKDFFFVGLLFLLMLTQLPAQLLPSEVFANLNLIALCGDHKNYIADVVLFPSLFSTQA